MMAKSLQKILFTVYSLKRFFVCLCLLISTVAAAQPANDNCSNAAVINIPASGFGMGKFNASTNNITQATLQAGETFAPAILVAGLNKKSMWYKFTIPTTRAIRVTLAQPGTDITAGDAGFAVYKVNSCLPKVEDISPKLTPIGTFGNTFHPCVDSGVYYIQVSANQKANGPLYIELQVSDSTGAVYDHPNHPYDFGVLSEPNASVEYAIGCHSIEEASEICASFPDAVKYHKSSWHTFTTPDYFDYMSVLLTKKGGGYFAWWHNFLKFGYRLYKGNSKITPVSGLIPMGDCDSLFSDGNEAGFKMYKCEDLEPNTTYTIQLFAHEDFFDDIRLTMSMGGIKPTQSPTPVLTPSNNFGTLVATPTAKSYTLTDYLACNSRLTSTSCSPALPPAGIDISGVNYNLSTFFTFTLAEATNIDFYLSSIVPAACGPLLNFRLFQQGLTANCADFDTTNLIGTYGYYSKVDCLWPGTYTVQVLGIDATASSYYFNHGSTLYGAACRASNLGNPFSLNMTLTRRVGANKFSLNVPGAFDSLNAVAGKMMPLEDGVLYRAAVDTFGCLNTVLPPDTTCKPENNKVMYRQISIGDSGVIAMGNMQWNLFYKLYSGDANALAGTQNAHSWPDRISGLQSESNCLIYNWYCNIADNNICVVPGTYTFATFGSVSNIGVADQPSFKFNLVTTKHYSPLTAQDMGSILDSIPTTGGSFKSDIDLFSCTDNAININGYVPCNINNKPATKAIYRQFYLREAAMVSIKSVSTSGYDCEDAPGVRTLFSGKITEGLAGLTPVGGRWECFASSNYKDCDLLPAGWYTVVSYGSGPTYDAPLKNVNEGGKYGSYVNKRDHFSIDLTVCAKPKFNRPFKASVNAAGTPHLIEWKERAASSPAYPITDTTYTLTGENFDCANDTPFSSHPLIACDTTMTKVAYWVFTTTQETYMEINTGGYWGMVYALDVRKDSALLTSATPVQPCVAGFKRIQLCRLPAGTYTLVIFAGASSVCSGVAPTIYVDQVRESRFDHANKAYDFDIVPPDSAWHYGKVGEVNPLHPNRPPGNDFFGCTTGSRPTDPTEGVCEQDKIYNMYDSSKLYMYEGISGGLNIVRRNLWYTFVVDKPGWVHVKVDSKTKGKDWTQILAVYRSNVEGTLPFSQVVSEGLVDSSLAQGLTFLGTNKTGFYCQASPNGMNFYRDPCTDFKPQRYYILVEETNPLYWGTMEPNNQVEVAVMVDSVNMVPTKYDHYYQAYDFGEVGVGKHIGGTDNFSCATREASDPLYIYSAYGCSKTLWYKFTATVTGTVRYRIKAAGIFKSAADNIQLFREVIPGDSTTKGLIYLPYSGYGTDTEGAYYVQHCVSPGTYYLILPGCQQLNEEVFPEIELLEQAGDFCNRPVVVPLGGAGTSVFSVVINCHTIGTDYGEFNPELTCPPGSKTSEYKSSWFRIDITGTDTLDVTTYLSENTNIPPEQIKYRMMTGNCGAMQEESCVLDSRTRNTYKCLTAGSYYLQVFTPVFTDPRYPGTTVTGDISLHLSAVSHADTCAPVKECFANANFVAQLDCTKDTAVRFVNYSTYGSSIEYQWNFGYDGQISTAVSPAFNYPVLTTDSTYQVTLKTVNTTCKDTGTVTIPVMVPARPKLDLGADTSFCSEYPGKVDAGINTWPGTTFSWENGSANPVIDIYTGGVTKHWVKATYKGCSVTDTIVVSINTIKSKKQTVVLCNTDSVLLSSDRPEKPEYLWSTGDVTSNIYVQDAGLYTSKLTWQGCTFIDAFNVIKPGSALGNDTSVCFNTPFILDVTAPGATYLWQDHSTNSTFSATGPGQYWVTLTLGTCIINDTLTLTGNIPLLKEVYVSICSAQNYTLPSGQVVATAGIYKYTFRYANGCDSLITNIHLLINSVIKKVVDTAICAGLTYVLPSGTVINTNGFYQDTLRFISGCDSLITELHLRVDSVQRTQISTAVCAGENYTLPSGKTINGAGLYQDTLKYISGCDSLITTVDLSLKDLTRLEARPTICSRDQYTLPSGRIVNIAGIYLDTLKYAGGCDSLITEIHLLINSGIKKIIDTTICSGATYLLPSGAVLNTTGIYQDTLRFVSGCDSLITELHLKVNDIQRNHIIASVCAGENYSLPSGKIIIGAGLYLDTLKYPSGCDSLITLVDLSIKSLTTINQKVAICSGNNYTLPSGKIISVSGIYNDTLKYPGGCDSLITFLDLAIQEVKDNFLDYSICEGQNFTLPWGETINRSGVYTHTLKSLEGCDSLKSTVSLTVKNVFNNSISASFCAGGNYVLPSGSIIFGPGTYSDTIRYISGCDSLITKAVIKLNKITRSNAAYSICAGQSFALPSGNIVSKSGVYPDTLRYTSGCDSLLTTFDIRVKEVTKQFSKATICQGQAYTLPSGQIINNAGTYSDTLRYSSGCDSLITLLDLKVTTVTQVSINPSICVGQSFTMPSGTRVNTAGSYTDIIKAQTGCDSMITYVTLKVHQKPVIHLEKSNDISCLVTGATLFATGGNRFQWWPEESLSNSTAMNPLATPNETTLYKVRVTSNQDCYSEDSILLVVNKGNVEGAFQLPNAFTPNNDGLNDCYGVKHWGRVTNFSLVIYNRFGNIVFQSTDPGKCWDGSYKGRQVDVGVYIFQISATTICGDIFRKGPLSVLR